MHKAKRDFERFAPRLVKLMTWRAFRQPRPGVRSILKRLAQALRHTNCTSVETMFQHLSHRSNPTTVTKRLVPARLIVVEPNALQRGGRIPESHMDAVVIVESAEDAVAKVLHRVLRHTKNLHESGRMITDALLVCASSDRDRQSTRLSLGTVLLDLLEEQGGTLRLVATRQDPTFANSLFTLAERLLAGRVGAASVRLEFPTCGESTSLESSAFPQDAGLLGSAA